jgi:hypothetical protein
MIRARRRFFLPWEIDHSGACLIVRDCSGQAIAYVCYEDEPGRRSAAKLLTRDEARRIAMNMAKLPGCHTSHGSSWSLAHVG